MKLSLDLRTSLSQTLTPQQIQYLKLLQLPLVQFEQQVRQEIEQNPMLDEAQSAEDGLVHQDSDSSDDSDGFEFGEQSQQTDKFEGFEDAEFPDSGKSLIEDQGDPFEFYKLLWQDDMDFPSKNKSQITDDEDSEPYQIKDNPTFLDEFMQQFRLLPLSREFLLLGEQIIGNLDPDGYLRRDLKEIVDDTNEIIAEVNYSIDERRLRELKLNNNGFDNPARQFAIPKDTMNIVRPNKVNNTYFSIPFPERDDSYLKYVSLTDAETVLYEIQMLEPPGIGSRTIQECLLSQCRVINEKNEAQILGQKILESSYEAFSMKHYNTLAKQYNVTEDQLRESIDFIRKLNPKPGLGESHIAINTVIPDFIVERDEENNDLLINVNDSRMPALKLNKAYEKLKKESKYKHFNKDTREWIRNKYEDAKFLIQAIRQRKSTMLKVMTAIAGLQKEFFLNGEAYIKPLIYKDVADNTGLDISTVCRIVNGKYVQTEYGTYELKYFFSESLPNEDGEEVSTRVIKQIIKEIIDNESKKKPMSDDKIALELKKRGYMVARRTVAKYREQLKLPVARLRKEI